MARELLRGYLQLAAGFGELTRTRAMEMASGLLTFESMGSATSKVTDAVTSLAEELMTASSINRQAVTELIRHEVESAVSRMGLVSAADLEQANQQVRRLQAQVAQLSRGGSSGSTPSSRSDSEGLAAGVDRTSQRPSPPGRRSRRGPGAVTDEASSDADKTPAPKDPPETQRSARKSAAKKATPTTPAAKRAPARKAPAKSAPTKKAPTKKAPAKKATRTSSAATEASAGKAPTKQATSTNASLTKTSAREAAEVFVSAGEVAPDGESTPELASAEQDRPE